MGESDHLPNEACPSEHCLETGVVRPLGCRLRGSRGHARPAADPADGTGRERGKPRNARHPPGPGTRLAAAKPPSSHNFFAL